MSEELKAALARIACLEGEIAKRDARIDELESRYQRDVYGLNNEGDPIGGDPAGGYANDNARLRTELAAIKAQEPVAWAGAIEYGVPLLMVEPQNWKATPLYAAPVSEAKAQGVVQWPGADEIMQMAFEEGQPADDASGYCFELEEFDLFIERLMSEVARLNAAPVQHAQLLDRSAIREVFMRNGFTIKEGQSDLKPYVYAAADELLRLAAPVQQVSVPDGKVCVPVEVLRLYEFMAASFTPFTSQHEQIAISLRKAKAAMLAAAPAAPAADAGLVEALKQAFPLFDEDGLNELYHHCEIAVLGDRKRLHKLLAAHRSTGVV